MKRLCLTADLKLDCCTVELGIVGYTVHILYRDRYVLHYGRMLSDNYWIVQVVVALDRRRIVVATSHGVMSPFQQTG